MADENYINSVNLNQNTNFPYLVLNVINEQSHPGNPGFEVMHWHEDLQFIYVFDGNVKVQTLNETVLLCKDEGIFINTNVVHLVEKTESCHYKSFIFPEYFITFYFGSPAKTLADKIIGNKNLPIYKLSTEIKWNRTVLEKLQKLSELEQNKTELYAYEVLVLLASLWLEMQKNIVIPSSVKNNVSDGRMKNFLQFISEHYCENISLDDLSASANVSKSECLRCFKNCLNTTPYKYLMEYRLSKAAGLLRNTSKPICEISSLTGLNQQSYFGKCFREKMSCSPRDYRNKSM